MKLLMTKNFNGIQLDCYKADNANDDFWATREQIGRLLEYSNPGISIGNIHNRNKERLDKFSRVNQIDLPSGGTQNVTVYNFKGLLEICRYSNQPKANAVMDFLWEIADEIRRTGYYSTGKHQKRMTEFDHAMKQGKEVYMSMGYRGKKLAVALDKIYKDYLGFSALEIAGIDLNEDVAEYIPGWIRRILDYLKEHESVTAMDLHRATGIPPNTAQSHLSRMTKKGYLRKIGYGVYVYNDAYEG